MLFLMLALWQPLRIPLWRFSLVPYLWLPAAARSCLSHNAFVGAQGIVLMLLLNPIFDTNTDMRDFIGISDLYAKRGALRRRDTQHSVFGRLITSEGPYAITRHPMYVGAAFALLVSNSMSVDRVLFLAGAGLYLAFFGLELEEQRLEVEFGRAYVAYRQRTPVVPSPTALAAFLGARCRRAKRAERSSRGKKRYGCFYYVMNKFFESIPLSL